MAEISITDLLVDELLALSSSSQQEQLLVDNGLADVVGLDALLTFAERSARHDPLQARALSGLCERFAEQFGAPTLTPRARYLRAQTYVLRSDPQTALDLIVAARALYAEAGSMIDALRTDVGAMTTLTALGRYSETLSVGDDALAQIDSILSDASQRDASAIRLIQAKIFVNQGPALSEMGRFDEALTAYASAEAIYAALGMNEDQVLVLSNRGVALRYLGRVDEALTAYEHALSLLPTSGYAYALLQNNIGDAHLLLGNYQASLTALSEARREFTRQDAEYDEQICAAHLADAYLALNLLPEALTLYQGAISSLQSTEYRYHLGKALLGIGSIHLSLSELDEAGRAYAQAIEIFSALDNRPLVAQIMLEESALFGAQDDHASALERARQAIDLLWDADPARWPVQKVFAHLRLFDLLAPAVEAAEDHLRRADVLLTNLTLPHLRFRLLHRQGRLLRLKGQDEPAQERFEAAIAEIERLRGSLINETMLVSFQQDKIRVYEDLIQLHLDRLSGRHARREDVEQVFDLIERAKSRALVERIARTVTAETTVDGEMEGQLEQLQAALNAIYNDMLGNDTNSPDARDTSGDRAMHRSRLSQRAAALERELSHWRLQHASRATTAAFEHPLPLRQIQADLSRDLTVVYYHVAGDEILAFLITRDAIQSVRRLSTPSAVQAQLTLLEAQWRHLKGDSEFVERHIHRLVENAVRPLHQLYVELVAPLEPLLSLHKSSFPDKLVIVPHGLLHQVPFQALHDGERYLIESAELSYAPSASILTMSERRQRRKTSKMLVLGVPDPAIPAVEVETRAIAQVLTTADLRMEEAATLDALLDITDSYRGVHFACHGIFRTDNPNFSALKLHDGWLTADQANHLNLDGALVVLSACESGRTGVLAGDETIGLTRAFLGAGATTVVVSHWLVQDDTGAMLMAEWYARLARGQDAATALRAAQLAIKSSHPHPYHWAPFALIGNRADPKI